MILALLSVEAKDAADRPALRVRGEEVTKVATVVVVTEGSAVEPFSLWVR